MNVAIFVLAAIAVLAFYILQEIKNTKERINHFGARFNLYIEIMAKDLAALSVNSEKKPELPVVERKKPGPKPQPKQKREVSDKQREAARLMMKRRWEAKKAAQSGIIHLPHQKSTSTELPEDFGIVRG